MSAPVLVTGAAGTIGAQIADALIAADRAVVLTDATQRPKEMPARVKFIQARLPEELDTLQASLPDKLSGLVHATGAIATHDALDWSDELFTSLFRTNVLVPLRVSTALADYLLSGSSVIFVGSVAGLRPTPKNMIYGATKAALHHAASSLSLTLAPRGIRVNVVAPGLIAGPLTDATDQCLANLAGKTAKDMAQSRIDAIPLGRIGAPEDIAAMVTFLLSGEAGFVTGTILPVTGGGHL